MTKSFRNNDERIVAFKDINLTVEVGEFVAILGPSGCGKSTLLRVLSGLEKASEGEFIVQHSSNANDIAMVFQEHGLFPWMTLKQNIQFVIENNPAFKVEQIRKICEEYLSVVGLLDYAEYYPHQVSGGMKQRISIARSFASNPDILLMDEPFVFLDYQTRFLIHELLLKIWRDSEKTILFVTHDIDEALLLADRIVVLSARPGVIIYDEKNKLTRPRDIVETRKLPEFINQLDNIIQLIRPEIVL